MGAWVRRVAVVVALAMVMGVASVSSPALAQSKASGPKVEQGRPGANVFAPGKANDKATGSPIPAEKNKGLLTGGNRLTAVGTPGEIIERRTEDSTTVLTDDGKFETTFYAGPVNYRDARGDFQPIDNTLVPAAEPGALRNKAGAVAVTLPGTLGDKPVRAAKGDTSVAFTLREASQPPPAINETTPSTKPAPESGKPAPKAGVPEPSVTVPPNVTTPPNMPTPSSVPAPKSSVPAPSDVAGPSAGEAAAGQPAANSSQPRTSLPVPQPIQPPSKTSAAAPTTIAPAPTTSAPAPIANPPAPKTSKPVSKALAVIGRPKGLPAASGEAADKASATYAGVLPGVDVAYTATPKGVKEDVVLAGPEAPTSFDFTVEASPGLKAVESGGGIDFVDAKGTPQASFAPPFAYDANFTSTGAEGSFTEKAVILRILESSPELVVRLEADPAWLGAPERAWPVVIDPVLTIAGPAPDTYLTNTAPDANVNTSSRLYLQGGGVLRRVLYAKDLAASFNEPVTLYSATLQLYAATDTSAQAAAPVGLHEMSTREWNSGAATWNTRLYPGLRWNSPGGDFVAQPTFVNPKVTGTPGWRSWPMTSLAQKWVDGTPFTGVMLKYENEASGALVGFASTSEPNVYLQPARWCAGSPWRGCGRPTPAWTWTSGRPGRPRSTWPAAT